MLTCAVPKIIVVLVHTKRIYTFYQIVTNYEIFCQNYIYTYLPKGAVQVLHPIHSPLKSSNGQTRTAPLYD